MSERGTAVFARYGVALGGVATATVLRLALDPILGTRFPFATLFFAVLLSAWFGGFGPALFASLCGGVAASWLLPEPLVVDGVENLGGLVLYLAVSLGIAAIGGAMHRARRRAQGETREAIARREQLHVTLESIGDAVITTDVDGRITSMNPVAIQLTGWSLSAALGRPLEEVFLIVHEHTREPTPNPVTRVLSEGRVVGLANHTVLIARDGRESPIDDSAAPIRDGIGGALRGVVLVFRDVTERRRTEERIRARESELNDLFENANVGLHWVAQDGTILRVNRAELELLGYAPEEYVGHPIAEFHADAAVIADILTRLGAGEALVGYPARMRCRDGSIKEVLINSSVLWQDGRFIHTRCFTLDVTARNRVVEAQALLAAIVESSEDAIVTKTLEGIVTSWNAGAERLFGYRREEMVGQSITLIIPSELRGEEQRMLERLRRGERVESFHTVRVTKSGRLVDISLQISPVRDHAGRIVGASKLARDVTLQRRAEEALRDADRRKDEFLATLAHELRNPLAPLRSSIEIVKRAEGDRELLQRAHDTMSRQMKQLERLVDELLDIARISHDLIELRRERMELAAVIQHALETCQPLADAGAIELTVQLPRQPLYLHGDAVRLAQVFGNLLNNACKYTERGGRVALEARVDGKEAVVSVRDNGRGIAREMLPRIFDMFTRVEPSGERPRSGLGIGLSLVRRLVEMHGGAVEGLSGGIGHGSEFVVRLPLSNEVNTASPTPAIPSAAHARRILVVDDNVDAAEALSVLLRMSGHDTEVAYDGDAAVIAARAYRPHVVLLDIGLPKLSGHEAARRIRAEPWGRDIVLVALTGWGQKEDRRKSREVGFDHHLVKPVEFAALMELLTELPRPPDAGEAR